MLMIQLAPKESFKVPDTNVVYNEVCACVRAWIRRGDGLCWKADKVGPCFWGGMNV